MKGNDWFGLLWELLNKSLEKGKKDLWGQLVPYKLQDHVCELMFPFGYLQRQGPGFDY